VLHQKIRRPGFTDVFLQALLVLVGAFDERFLAFQIVLGVKLFDETEAQLRRFVKHMVVDSGSRMPIA
jgi:hypothetical protein